ncbi:MAG: hypothetical protein OXD43_00425 [Bacteroidetes bacterium]|nr:hypothetical protein [Bacteroidota bacterium]
MHLKNAETASRIVIVGIGRKAGTGAWSSFANVGGCLAVANVFLAEPPARGGRMDSKITYRRGDAVEVILRAARSYNRVRCLLNESLNQSYTNSMIDVDAYWHFANVWSMESSLKYRVLDRDVFGAGHKIALLNPSLSCLFFGGRGNMQFEVNDVLNQNQIVRFTNRPPTYKRNAFCRQVAM